MNNPAILWYPNDFISSTTFWSNEQCGAYIRLLCYQYILGHLTKEQMNQVTKDKLVIKKFVKDENGLFYNPRMEKEIIKRKKYCESRSKNKLGKTKTNDKDKENITKSYDLSYDNHTRNSNSNSNNNIEILINYFNNNIHSITKTEYDVIIKWRENFSDEMILKAFEESVLRNVKTMKYINGILKNWQSKGYKRPSDIEEQKKECKEIDWNSEDE